MEGFSEAEIFVRGKGYGQESRSRVGAFVETKGSRSVTEQKPIL
jgi:hypothetical protein